MPVAPDFAESSTEGEPSSTLTIEIRKLDQVETTRTCYDYVT